MVDRNDIVSWQAAKKGIFLESPEDAMGHLRIYCGPACVAMIPIFDETEEAFERALKTAHFVAEAANHGITAHGLTSTEVSLLEQDKKIQAIKSLRTRLNCGLREAKAMIDAVAKACDIRICRGEDDSV